MTNDEVKSIVKATFQKWAASTIDVAEGAGTLSKKIGDASPKIKAGIGTIDTAASQISDGAKTLASGTN